MPQWPGTATPLAGASIRAGAIQRTCQTGPMRVVVVLVLLVAGAGCSSGIGGDSANSTPASAQVDSCKDYPSEITEESAGQEIRIPPGRFSICLDEVTHPLRRLDVGACPIGWVSNLSLAGPESYPRGYEVTGTGSCTLRNGDFQVQLVLTA